MFANLIRKKSVKEINELAVSENMHKVLNVKDLTLFGIAAIVGAGIFSTIGNAVVNGGPAVSLLFVFTALSCGLSALCYAQFASTVPVSGSAYTYAYVSFGELIAWIVGWDLFMEYAISNVAVSISWSDYFCAFLQGFNIHISKEFWGFHIDFPAFGINLIITYICYIGIRESKNANIFLVALKLFVILMVLGIGAFYVKPENWTPFAPNGLSGVMMGVSSVFFAYIGFDAISTTAEECRNPQKELPQAMIYSLVISTIIYVLITLVLTGMVPYFELGVGDPLSFVFQKYDLGFISGIISFSSVIALSSAMLVYQLGQPRIWMSMSRDGLLPKIFSKMHPKFKTPSFSTILMGAMVGIPALFVDMKEVVDLTSIGTLFAFALVCGGVMVKELNGTEGESKFKIPYFNARYFLVPILFVFYLILDGNTYFAQFLENFDVVVMVFFVVGIAIVILAYVKKLSSIPVLGLLSNLYLMAQLGTTNWLRFSVWLALGLILYFSYGYKNSKLNTK